MKKLFTFSIIAYLLFTINTNAVDENSTENENILKIGVLLPLTGQHQDTGQSFLKAIQLAIFDIGNKKIKIYPRDSKGNAFDAYEAAKEFEKLGIKIVIGPIFFESLEKLNEINNITFISMTNRTQNLPKNAIAFGINVKSQIDAIKKYFGKIEVSRTLLLSPKDQFIDQTTIIEDSKIKLYRTFFYDISAKKITGEIEKLTKYRERKKDLERRIKILEKSDLEKHKYELKQLEQRHTLGRVNFDSVIIVDFGERLKSVLTSFQFSDVSNKEVNFFTLNQWFDETLFNEEASQNLYFPAINFDNLIKFEKKYSETFGMKPNGVAILAYDALGLLYYCWISNNDELKIDHLFSKEGFKGLHGEFVIKNNISQQKLNIYKISDKKFLEVF